MFENIFKFFKKANKDKEFPTDSKSAAKERLHLVLMQDRANVSADFLDLMKQEIIEVIKKYIEVDERAIDVRLTNKENEDGTNGAPALYANIPILNIKNEARKVDSSANKEAVQEKVENKPKSESEQVQTEQENISEEQEVKEEKAEVIETENEANSEEVKEENNIVEENTEEKTEEKVESTTENK